MAIPSGILAILNGLLASLGYPTLSHDSDSPGSTSVTRTRDATNNTEPGLGRQDVTVAVDQFEKLLIRKVSAGQAVSAPEEPIPTFCVTVTLPQDGAGHDDARTWRIDPVGLTIERVDTPADAVTDWGVTGDMGAWTSVLAGQVNLATAMRQNQIRYNDKRTHDRFQIQTDTRFPVLARLLASEPSMAVIRSGARSLE